MGVLYLMKFDNQVCVYNIKTGERWKYGVTFNWYIVLQEGERIRLLLSAFSDSPSGL